MIVNGPAADNAPHFPAEYQLNGGFAILIPRRGQTQTETLTLVSATGSRGFK